MKSLALLSLYVQLALAIQPSARPAEPGEIRQLHWGKLNFLATTDTHGWHAGHLTEPQYSADWGDYYSFTHHMRNLADQQGVDLLIVDTGDRIEGSGLSDATNPVGKHIREIFTQIPMDIVTIGNHELYREQSSINEYLIMRPHYGDKWVVSNVEIHDPETGVLVPLGNRFRKFKTKNQGVRITAFAFLFDFKGAYKNTVVQEVEDAIKEDWFQNAIRDTDVDLFVIIGHTPVRDSPEFPAILEVIRAIHPTIPVQFFGGHTHIRDFTVYDDASTGIESGRFCESVGFLSISHIPSAAEPEPITFHRRYLDFNRVSFTNHTLLWEEDFDTPKGVQISERITQLRSNLGLDKLYGCAPQDYYLSRVPYPHKDSLYSLFGEKILPSQARSPEREGVPTLVFVNMGSQRFDIFKGPFTWDVSFTVSPFNSAFRYIKDVPYVAAKELINLFNNDSHIWMKDLEHADTSVPLGPLEPYYHFRKLWKQAAKNSSPYTSSSSSSSSTSAKKKFFEPSTEALGMQEVLAELNPSGDDDDDDDKNYTYTPTTSNDKHRTLYPPGYRTIDDFGSSGDDTIHSPIKYYDMKNCMVSNHSFSDGLQPETVDVVFFDFIERYIIAGLRYLGQRYEEEHVRPYLPEAVNMRTMMLGYALEEWQGEC
ncbi:Metallo-dependent phosphatase-like protein [Peziza echinospora]|nr:Metallo-dependent phosphatase-like protein [Peziza echinospora]